MGPAVADQAPGSRRGPLRRTRPRGWWQPGRGFEAPGCRHGRVRWAVAGPAAADEAAGLAAVDSGQARRPARRCRPRRRGRDSRTIGLSPWTRPWRGRPAHCRGRGRTVVGLAALDEAARPMAAAMDESAGRSWGPPRRTRRQGLRPSTVDKAARRSARRYGRQAGGARGLAPVDKAMGLAAVNGGQGGKTVGQSSWTKPRRGGRGGGTVVLSPWTRQRRGRHD